jgi:hypothetical protein
VQASSDKDALNFIKLEEQGREYLAEREADVYRVLTPDNDNGV